MTRAWYAIKAAADDAAEVAIYDEIGAWGIRASDFIRDIKALGNVKAITLAVNSPGGEVFDGIAIYNFLQRHPASVTVRVDGVAASIASVIAMAGDRVVMPENSFLMLHDPSGLVVGTSDDMRDIADTLDKIKGSLVSAYRTKSGKDDDEIMKMMKAETWLTAAEAVEHGFADEIVKPVKMAAHAALSRLPNLPAALADKAARGVAAQSLEEPTMSEKKAAGADPATTDTLPAERVDVEKITAEARAKALAEFQARAAEITELCMLSGSIAKAAGLIASNKSTAEIRRALIDERAKASDDAEIEKHREILPNGGASAANNYGWDAIFAKASAWRAEARK